MLKKTITYTDFNGVERTEDHYFNLTDTELTEMEASVNGGFTVMINRIIAAKDMPTIMKVFKEIILKSYGEKSADGKYLRKIAPDGHRLAEDFAQTNAFDKLFMEVAFDAEKGAAFIKGIVPAERAAQAQAEAAKQLNG